MKIEDGKIFLLDEHLDRMTQTAEYFLFSFDKKKIKSYLSNIVSKTDTESYRLRLSLDKDGKFCHVISKLMQLPQEIKVIISKNRFIRKTDSNILKLQIVDCMIVSIKALLQKGFLMLFILMKEVS